MTTTAPSDRPDMRLFWACFIALVATSFVFGVRANTIGDLQATFNLSEQQKGAINGAGMWPFALSIILFSLIIDRIGYKTVAIIAVACHTIALVLTLRATGYESFYWSTLLVSVGNGTVEAFVNPVVATLFPRQKAKWLNILHAGWPAGLALGALFTVLIGSDNTDLAKKLANIRWAYATCFIPVLIYAGLILRCRFPANERVAAGVTYRDMLREVGAVGFFIIAALTVPAVSQMMNQPASLPVVLSIAGAVAVAMGLYTGSLGNWLFISVLVIIGPLATTELGTDGWMPDLLKLNGPGVAHFEAWIFIYTSVIMTALRFYAGPIVHRFSPIGLLVLGSAIAVVGLLCLSQSAGWFILGAATVYALGKTFLWSTTLGLVSEQFPKGGALTLNGVSAVGVLFLGVLGSPAIGYKQDVEMDKRLSTTEYSALYAQVKGADKTGIFGSAPSLDQEKVNALSPEDHTLLKKAQAPIKQQAFRNIAVLPAFMLVCYLGLFLYFKAKGGYKPVLLGKADEADPGF